MTKKLETELHILNKIHKSRHLVLIIFNFTFLGKVEDEITTTTKGKNLTIVNFKTNS